MPAELGDERSFKDALSEVSGRVGKEQIEEAVDYAVQEANRALLELGENPPPDATLNEWSVQAIADSVETYWDPSEPQGKLDAGDSYVAEWTHEHADKLNIGVKPHMIEGNPILVFEWPNAPDEVREEFKSQWENPDSFLEEPQVAYAEIQHPGIPATGYIQGGFKRALQKFFT